MGEKRELVDKGARVGGSNLDCQPSGENRTIQKKKRDLRVIYLLQLNIQFYIKCALEVSLNILQSI